MIVISLPLPPTGNKLWAPVRTRTGARLVKRAASSDWAALAQRLVREQAMGAAIAGPFAAHIIFPQTRADLDGRIKPILDALQAGGAIANDRHCRRLLVEIDPGLTLAVVHLTAIPPLAPAPRRIKGERAKETTP